MSKDITIGEGEGKTETRLFDWRAVPWQRVLRLTSGLVLFVFVLAHLLNHAVGLLGIEAMDVVQTLRWEVQRSKLGLVILIAAAGTHVLLGVWRTASRRTLKMPIDEAFQLATGLAIPFFLLPHIVHTRINDYYYDVLFALWPGAFWWQMTLVLIVWCHGVLGLVMAFRARAWFSKVRVVGFSLAIIIPVLALAGFVSAGREADTRVRMPKPVNPDDKAWVERAISTGNLVIGGTLILLLLGVKLGNYGNRRFGKTITITYRGRGAVKVPCGTSVLEASRLNDIPHPSLCRGKGRCSTCRVQVLTGLEDLPPPSAVEKALLEKVGARPNVRLACQLRPHDDVNLRILLPVIGGMNDAETRAELERWAVERTATILSLDLRAFGVLERSRLPYELVSLVNRFASEMTQAVEHYGGTVSNFYGQGLEAVFDHVEDHKGAARRALLATRDMARVLETLNREMAGALPIPIRAAIGLHTGPVTLARIGETEEGAALMAFGQTVNIAKIIRRATKGVVADCLISQSTLDILGASGMELERHEVEVEGQAERLHAYAISDWHFLDRGFVTRFAPFLKDMQAAE